MIKRVSVILLTVLLSTAALAANLSLDDVIAKLKTNQDKIQDLYAETTSIITSNMSFPGQSGKGPQKIVQKGKMWTKGEDKTKLEMVSPTKQITITNGDKMAMINPETGQKVVQDLKKLRSQGVGGNQERMSLEKAKEYFNLSVTNRQDPDTKQLEYVVTGIPKKENKLIGKMEFYLDPSNWVPVKVIMCDPKGNVFSQSTLTYQTISGAQVPIKTVSHINTPMGKMDVEMSYDNVRVNKGINDREFKIE